MFEKSESNMYLTKMLELAKTFLKYYITRHEKRVKNRLFVL